LLQNRDILIKNLIWRDEVSSEVAINGTDFVVSQAGFIAILGLMIISFFLKMALVVFCKSYRKKTYLFFKWNLVLWFLMIFQMPCLITGLI
jgi:hypothetical protein